MDKFRIIWVADRKHGQRQIIDIDNQIIFSVPYSHPFGWSGHYSLHEICEQLNAERQTHEYSR